MDSISQFFSDPFHTISTVLALAALITGSVTDLKRREVPDFVNYGLFFAAILLRLSFGVWTMDVQYFIEGLLGFAVCAGIGLLMFYTGQWGGGDAKMLIGLGTLIGMPFSWPLIGGSMLVALLVNMLFSGSFYGVLWGALLITRHFKVFKKHFIALMSQSLRSFLIALGIFMVSIITSIVFGGLALPILMMGSLPLVVMFLFVVSKSTEKGCMVRAVPIAVVTEGDWIEKSVSVNGKYVCGPKDLGISLRQIALLKKLKVKTVQVKYGIPFVPSFLLAYLLTMFLGNLVTILVRFLTAYVA